MRYMLILAFGAALSLAGAVNASADDTKAVNTVCPNSGKPIDPTVPTIAATDTSGKTVQIGACCNNCAAKIKKDPTKFVAAAEADKKASL
jgi:hypothetical protein